MEHDSVKDNIGFLSVSSLWIELIKHLTSYDFHNCEMKSSVIEIENHKNSYYILGIGIITSLGCVKEKKREKT